MKIKNTHTATELPNLFVNFSHLSSKKKKNNLCFTRYLGNSNKMHTMVELKQRRIYVVMRKIAYVVSNI